MVNYRLFIPPDRYKEGSIISSQWNQDAYLSQTVPFNLNSLIQPLRKRKIRQFLQDLLIILTTGEFAAHIQYKIGERRE